MIQLVQMGVDLLQNLLNVSNEPYPRVVMHRYLNKVENLSLSAVEIQLKASFIALAERIRKDNDEIPG